MTDHDIAREGVADAIQAAREVTGPKYSKGAWLAANERYQKARQAKEAAQELSHKAMLEEQAAAANLVRQEASPGVPAWQHLQTAPANSDCRMDYCSVHSVDGAF